MSRLSFALVIAGLLATSNAGAAPSKRAASKPLAPALHCPLPGDPDGMEKRLGPQGKLYCSELESFAATIETPGVDMLETAVRKAFEQGVYNEWTLAAEEVLAEYVPAYATPVRELPLVASQSM